MDQHKMERLCDTDSPKAIYFAAVMWGKQSCCLLLSLEFERCISHAWPSTNWMLQIWFRSELVEIRLSRWCTSLRLVYYPPVHYLSETIVTVQKKMAYGYIVCKPTQLDMRAHTHTSSLTHTHTSFAHYCKVVYESVIGGGELVYCIVKC